MEEQQCKELSKKLGILIKLLALQSVGSKNFTEAISTLSRFGLQPKEIAEILGTTPNSVSVALSTIRKKEVGKDAKKE
jgi:hypothetical protein